MEEPHKSPLLTNRMYDLLKFFAQIVLPAFGTLYFSLASIWGLPNPDEVVGTILAVDTFLGILLGISSKTYSDSPQAAEDKLDGYLQFQEIEQEDGSFKKVFDFNLNQDPQELEDKQQISFRVVKS